MMDDLIALYTATRRYCTDRAQELRIQYFDRINEPDPPFSVWPRVALLDALLADIESVAPDQFSSLDALRNYLLLAGSTATSAATKQYSSLGTDLIDEERDRFRIYVEGLTAADLRNIAPLPSRRRLSDAESGHVWDALDQRWQTHGGKEWYPLTKEEPPGVIAFQAASFHRALPDEYLRGLLGDHSIERCWELYEHGWVLMRWLLNS